MSIEVHTTIDGAQRLVGHLHAQRRRNVEASTFSYVDSWVGQPGAFALEPALPMVLGPLATPAGRALPGALSDSATITCATMGSCMRVVTGGAWRPPSI